MLAYISKNADQNIIDSLISHGFTPAFLAPCEALPEPVSSHTDMLMLTVGETAFVSEDHIPEDLCGFERIIAVKASFGKKYPFDVPLNIAVVGDTVFANTKYASREVLNALSSMGKSIIHVSQGYAHCSTCIVSDDAIISADSGIVSAARKAGIDALQISQGYISLPPYDYGFIGGCCGVTSDSVYFCGSLAHHPDGERIREFCISHGKRAVELTDAPLHDVGGIIFK